MKWLTNKTGDIRDRVIFAWTPKKCADGFTRRFVWLNVRESFRESAYDEDRTDFWEPVRYTPINADPEAEAEAAAAQLVRDSRPNPPVFQSTLSNGFISFEREEGDEWKTPKPEETKDEDDDE